jgi:tetratricopeptide (TPR) repeat protein
MQLKRLGVLAVSALFVSTPVAAQDWSGVFRFSGSVADEEGNPLEGATVAIYIDEPGRGPEPMVTKKNGRFAFLGLKTGVWTVSVEMEGKMPSEGQVNVGSATPPLQIKLRDMPEELLYNEQALEAKKRLDEGNALLTAGDYAGARAKFEEGMADLGEEHRPAILLAIADTWAAEGNAARRLETLQQAQAIAPGDPSVLLALARAHYDSGDVDSAISELRGVVEAEPDNTAVLQVLVDMLVAEGRVDEAQEYIARLPEGSKLDPNALLNVGIDHYNAGELDEAFERFDEVVRNYPELPTALYYRGLVYLGRGENDLARADLEQFLAAEPDSPKAAEAREFLEYLQPDE